MAYNEQLADRIREILSDADINVFEKRMFSGLSFLVDNKLCISVADKGRILLRLSPADFEIATEKPGVDLMVRNGKAMRGYVFVHDFLLNSDSKLKYWVNQALAFNPLAKSSKK